MDFLPHKRQIHLEYTGKCDNEDHSEEKKKPQCWNRFPGVITCKSTV